MAKRFTDTEKWRDEWWGSLSNDYRMIWLYLVDSCSIAGIWKKDFRGLNFNCNTKIEEKEFLEVFGSRIIDRGNFVFIPKFLRFQCPKGLNSNKPAIISIIKELQLNNLIEIVHQSLGNDFLIIKDKDKGTDKGKGKDKDKGTGKILVDGDSINEPSEVVQIMEIAYGPQLNSMEKEHGNGSWVLKVSDWLKSVQGQSFNDKDHVKNSFKKWYITNGRPQKKQESTSDFLKRALE